LFSLNPLPSIFTLVSSLIIFWGGVSTTDHWLFQLLIGQLLLIFFFNGTGVWTQGFTLAKQASEVWLPLEPHLQPWTAGSCFPIVLFNISSKDGAHA
jgi:hypothetical protein